MNRNSLNCMGTIISEKGHQEQLFLSVEVVNRNKVFLAVLSE